MTTSRKTPTYEYPTNTKKTYTKVTETTTICTETFSDGRTKVYTWYEDAEDAFATMPKEYNTEAEAQAQVIKIATRILNIK